MRTNDIVKISDNPDVFAPCESPEYCRIVVKRDDDCDIKFTGEEVAFAASSDNNACSNYSGSTGRWAELTLYRTKGGKYICERVDYSKWLGERNLHSGAICESVEDVISFFGNDWLAKELYGSAGIDAAIEVE